MGWRPIPKVAIQFNRPVYFIRHFSASGKNTVEVESRKIYPDRQMGWLLRPVTGGNAAVGYAFTLPFHVSES